MADYMLGKGRLWQGSAAMTRGLFVKDGTVAQSATAIAAITDIACGVLQESFAATDAATGKLVVPIWLPGSVSRVVANAAIAKGAKVAPAANGKAQTAVSTQFPVGIAMSAAAASGDEIDVMLVAPIALAIP
jgi:hypothetical protein